MRARVGEAVVAVGAMAAAVVAVAKNDPNQEILSFT